jgi:DNA adenine methylase
MNQHSGMARPFLKWAGGKRQLLPVITVHLDHVIKNFNPKVFVEPFVGSGAVFIDLLNRYPDNFHQVIINDQNPDLIAAYQAVKTQPEQLIEKLSVMKQHYQSLSETDRKNFYYLVRNQFNENQRTGTKRAARLIFLNKTCYNGLYRVNRKGAFNVPYGSYKQPSIFDEENLMRLHKMLQKVTLYSMDFEDLLKNIPEPENTLLYFDPPYRPISKTASFKAYAQTSFGDEEQIRLARQCQKMDKLGSKWLLSNSDPGNHNPEDLFFHNLYRNYQIKKVPARRSINASGKNRGAINELIISNF